MEFIIRAVSVGEQSQAINKIWGVENYSRYFLYSRYILHWQLDPRKALPFIPLCHSYGAEALGTST